MGGTGSGRWHYHEKQCLVEDTLKVPTTPLHPFMTALHRGEPTTTQGVLDWWRGDERIASLSFCMVPLAAAQSPHADILVQLAHGYRGNAGKLIRTSAIVPVCSTIPAFGGRRWWWRCPSQTLGTPCNRRVGVLYLPSPGSHLACRTCHALTYRSAQHSHTRLAAAMCLTPEERDARIGDGDRLDLTELRILLRASYLHDERAQPIQIRVRGRPDR